jgi:hypothetical protein
MVNNHGGKSICKTCYDSNARVIMWSRENEKWLNCVANLMSKFAFNYIEGDNYNRMWYVAADTRNDEGIRDGSNGLRREESSICCRWRTIATMFFNIGVWGKSLRRKNPELNMERFGRVHWNLTRSGTNNIEVFSIFNIFYFIV